MTTLSTLEPWDFIEPKLSLSQPSLLPLGTSRQVPREEAPLGSHLRSYRAGDPLGRIDWKTFARTDLLQIREEPKASQNSVVILIDQSPTMDWPEGEGFPKKKNIALRVGFHLAACHVKGGDSVRLVLCYGPKKEELHLLKSYQETLALFESYSSSQKSPGLGETLWQDLRPQWVYLLTDALSELSLPPGWPEDLGILFHILSSKEVDLSWTEATSMYWDHQKNLFSGRDLKTPETRAAIEGWQKKLAEAHPRGYRVLTDRTLSGDYWGFLEKLWTGG
jgi:hypothetical protein